MDTASSLHSYGPVSQWRWPSSDSEFYSTSSPEAMSPDCSLEPPFSRCSAGAQPGRSAGDTGPRTPASCTQDAPTRVRQGRARSRNPSKQRQSASEKEKLRMRGLTKALHHLRSYLPPSMAPAGQALTKIETLRLAIRYIAHLSAQLGHTEEALPQPQEPPALACPSVPRILGFGHPTVMMSDWKQGQQQHAGLYQTPDTACLVQSTHVEQVHSSVAPLQETPVQEDYFSSSLDSGMGSPLYPETAANYQVYNTELGCQGVSQEFWL